MGQLKQKATEAAEQLQTAVSAAAGKNAERIIVLDVSQTLAITDHFLICSGNSERQVHAIADAVERGLRDEWSIKPLRREGHRESRWVILDYGDFLVHAFHREERDYYDLERLWADAPVLDLQYEENGQRSPRRSQEDGLETDESAATAEAP